MTILVVLFAIVLTFWLILSVPAQVDISFPPKWWWLRRLLKPIDPFGLIPRWTFFAPNPGIHDHHLVFRVGPDDTHLSEWREFDIIGGFSPLRAIWNPRKRERKCFTDNVFTLLRELRFCNFEKRPQAIQLSPSYLLMLNVASAAAAGNKYVQFALMRSDGGRSVWPLFVSYIHEVETWD